MGLGSVLNTANAGLRVTQASLDIAARNIANADTPGYTRKSLGLGDTVAGLAGAGVRELDVTRAVDAFLQSQTRLQSTAFAAAETRHQFMMRIDQMFGAPGAGAGLDSRLTAFENSLQMLVASPDSFTVREAVVAQADSLAQGIRQLSLDVQALRQLAEDSLARAIDDVNAALGQLERVNTQLNGLAAASTERADLLDERDRLLALLARDMDIRVTTRDNGTVSVFTRSGNALLEGGAAELVFDHHGDLSAHALYSDDPAERGVGTVQINFANGYALDLIQSGALDAGRIGALIELRDVTLVATQAQLDELAHGLALSFANRQVAGEGVTIGPQQGFDVDTAGLLPGNTISLTYTETPPGEQRTVSIVRVDDPAQLPLANDVTPDPGDTVIGIDFSGGLAAAATAIEAALGGAISVSAPGGTVLRFLDDGAAGTIDLESLGATISSAATQDDGLQLPLFTDGVAPYSASLDGGPQKLGFAARISLNGAVRENNELLVRYASAPPTPIGDSARPLDLLARFGETDFTFSPASGIGRAGAPFSGTIRSFAQRLISVQTGQAEQAERALNAAEVTFRSLQDRLEKQSAVDINQELSDLIALQNAFAANARVVETADRLMQLLLRL